ncbi:MAG TPA: lytic transglycosylase domain-containing protein [Gemmatimonadales bacterium]|nr:lytic transglycosylase domain-containing protein [Gemmatimonadales bacterium]
MLLSQLSLLLALTTSAPQAYAVASATEPVAPAATVSTSTDSVLDSVRDALLRGRPWQASLLVAPVLSDTQQRSPVVVYLAATAASRWGGWGEVGRLLEGESWVDSLFGGRARVMLARAALERGADSAALAHALTARRGADAESEGERLLLLAAALERLDARDSAAATWEQAAERLPLVADWLLVRAAAVNDDSTARARLYALIGSRSARERVRWSEAAAHERTGDLEGAADRYARLGARLTALRLRIRASADSAPRAAVRRDLFAVLEAGGSPAAVRDAIGLLDSLFTPLQPAEELSVGLAAEEAGLAQRATEGLAKAFAAGLGASGERYAYANALARLGRHGDAAFQYNLVRSPRSLAAHAAYLRARELVRDGQLVEGRSALLAITRTLASDSNAASSALYLLGDLASDDGADRLARTYYRRAALRYPGSRFAAPARFRAAMIELLTGDPGQAGREFDELARRFPRSDEAPASVYWAGRAWATASDSVAARKRWEQAAAADPVSYYASLASRRLGRTAWVPSPASDSFVAVPDVDSAVARAQLLERLGLSAESRWEWDRLARSRDENPERLLAIANALRAGGHASQAIQLARKALARGAAPDARTYRLIYPVVHEEALLAEAAEQRIDPSFVAALIRQESMFNPAATSAVGARGLMQVMPELAGRLAGTLGYPVWDPVLLYQPDVSLQLGSYHLQELVSRYDRGVEVLAAYNAGASRVERWVRRGGVDDPEVFAERIPFVETRGYVRVIQRNQELYRALYHWPDGRT